MKINYSKLSLVLLLLLASGFMTYSLMDQFGGRTIMSCESIEIQNSTGIFVTHLGCIGGSNSMKVNETVAIVIWDDFFNSSSTMRSSK